MTTTRRAFVRSSLTLAVALPLLAVAQENATEGAPKKAEAAAPKLKASGGARITKSDAQKVHFTIKCKKCGYRTNEIVIDTPTTDKPYKQEWKCPKCGFVQSVVIEVVTD